MSISLCVKEMIVQGSEDSSWNKSIPFDIIGVYSQIHNSNAWVRNFVNKRTHGLAYNRDKTVLSTRNRCNYMFSHLYSVPQRKYIYINVHLMLVVSVPVNISDTCFFYPIWVRTFTLQLLFTSPYTLLCKIIHV